MVLAEGQYIDDFDGLGYAGGPIAPYGRPFAGFGGGYGAPLGPVGPVPPYGAPFAPAPYGPVAPYAPANYQVLILPITL